MPPTSTFFLCCLRREGFSPFQRCLTCTPVHAVTTTTHPPTLLLLLLLLPLFLPPPGAQHRVRGICHADGSGRRRRRRRQRQRRRTRELLGRRAPVDGSAAPGFTGVSLEPGKRRLSPPEVRAPRAPNMCLLALPLLPRGCYMSCSPSCGCPLATGWWWVGGAFLSTCGADGVAPRPRGG